MDARQILGYGLVALLFLAFVYITVFIMKDQERFRRYRRNLFLLMVLIFSIAGLMELLLPENCCLKLLIIPIFSSAHTIYSMIHT
jgi:hypothetical protein